MDVEERRVRLRQAGGLRVLCSVDIDAARLLTGRLVDISCSGVRLLLPRRVEPQQVKILEELANGIIPADEMDGGAACVEAGRKIAEKIDAERGYKDIDPERCWEQWQEARKSLV